VFGLLERMVADPAVSAGNIEAVRAPESPTLQSWTPVCRLRLRLINRVANASGYSWDTEEDICWPGRSSVRVLGAGLPAPLTLQQSGTARRCSGGCNART
jgi:hypothetical protein